ncbi:MAG: acyl-CoA thioesterase [Candidatus Methanosuratincola sp.]
MFPSDANPAGNVFGGSIVRYVDEVAAAVAMRHARKNVVIASMDRMDFHTPVKIGDLIILKASVNYVGRTSMEIGVRVEAENLMTGEVRHAASAYATMVALDESGKPTEVPRLIPETEEEKRRYREGEARRQARLKAVK